MAKTAEELMHDVFALSDEERERFMVALLDAFALPEEEPTIIAEREAAWAEEIRRRIEDIDSGRDEGIPAEDVFAKLEAKYAGRRKSA